MQLQTIRAALGPNLAIVPEALHDLMIACTGGPDPEAAARRPRAPRVQGQVAILPMTGLISPRPLGGLFETLFGGTDLAGFGLAFDEMLSNEAVGGIVLDVDSPGGSVQGLPEMAAKIRTAREQKPIVAVAGYQASSAAYYLASQAGQMYAAPSAVVGSIGVILIFIDDSEAMAKEGLKPIVMSAGRYKAEWWDVPVSDEAIAARQQVVDRYYEMFVRDVAAGRGVAPARVRDGYGEGRELMAGPALAEGMIDGVKTLEEVVGEMTGGRPAPASRRARAVARKLRILGDG